MNKQLRILIGVVLLLLAGLFAYGLRSGPSDRELIRTAMAEAIKAAQEGRPGPVNDFVSRSATLDGEGGASSGQVADFVKKSRPTIVLVNDEPAIRGDEAEIVSPVKVTLTLLGFERTFDLPEVHVRLARESTLKWGIVPTSKWRITQISTNQDFGRELTPP